jgi:cysteinyl-tRNA synthetase
MTHRITVYNSLGHEKQAFQPLDPTHVKIYVCGPTVYNYAHIGNGRAAVVFDTWRRLMMHLYPRVTYVSNITDIDDKIIQAAKDTGKSIDEITTHFTEIYNADMAALNVMKPDIQPLATTHIPEMIALIQRLIDHGHAYEADGHVLFHVPSYNDYGALSRRNRDEQIAGARVDVASYKKDPADFVLWKPSLEGDPVWDSPFGRGRPGWHIECSAMAEKHLGVPFDIHGGGIDLTFPHHENEIAQSCCAHTKGGTETSYAKYWLHNGFLTMDAEKMSKSIGNVLLVHDLLKDIEGEVIRLTLLSAQYRQPLDWSDDTLLQHKKILDRLYTALYQSREYATDLNLVDETVLTALCNDLNTPQAIAALLECGNQIFAALEKNDIDALKTHRSTLLKSAHLLGILTQDPATWLGYGAKIEGITANEIDTLIQDRNNARSAKDFAKADAIRQKLSDLGIQIDDTPQGTTWRKV